MADDALRRILAGLGDPDLADRLGALPGADLTSLLLAVMRTHVAGSTEADVLHRYTTDRFSAPGAVPPADLDAARALLIDGLPDRFERITLAPVAPIGTHAALGGVDQNNVLSTVRGSEVAADNTAGMALEATVRRRRDRTTPVHLAASQRITRAQPFDGPMAYAHFEVFGLVTAGRDTGNLRFERETFADHVGFFVAALASVADSVRVRMTDYEARLGAVIDAVRDQVGDQAAVEPWPDRRDGAAYYEGLRFTVYATRAGIGYDLADGGPVDWTQRLLSDRKERLVTSGIGLDRLAMLMHAG